MEPWPENEVSDSLSKLMPKEVLLPAPLNIGLPGRGRMLSHFSLHVLPGKSLFPWFLSTFLYCFMETKPAPSNLYSRSPKAFMTLLTSKRIRKQIGSFLLKLNIVHHIEETPEKKIRRLGSIFCNFRPPVQMFKLQEELNIMMELA